MNKDTLIFIDSYISNFDRVKVCADLIKQVREFYPEYKIALLNKYPDSWRLDSLVDYYFYYGDSIMVGAPPQELIDKELYELGYVYVNTPLGTCENWVPLTGVTDHVASIYNGFILSARIAKSLGFKKVFKILKGEKCIKRGAHVGGNHGDEYMPQFINFFKENLL